MKICSKCKVSKSGSEFSLVGRRRPGKSQAYCKECYNLYQKEKYHKDVEASRKRNNERRVKNIEARRESSRKWAAKNPDGWKRYRKTRKDYVLRELKNNPLFRLVRYMRTRLYQALKTSRKSENTLSLIGATVTEFAAHLETRFKPGMTWENYGPVWHVDHIKPCAKFDLTDPAQQRACFHWTNLQPLFAKENLQKGDSYEPPTDTVFPD